VHGGLTRVALAQSSAPSQVFPGAFLITPEIYPKPGGSSRS
jgi:hypothetical protein